jgi:hypothetical protein
MFPTRHQGAASMPYVDEQSTYLGVQILVATKKNTCLQAADRDTKFRAYSKKILGVVNGTGQRVQRFVLVRLTRLFNSFFGNSVPMAFPTTFAYALSSTFEFGK